MHPKRFKGGFTLVEVNLAIFVMAVGILSVCQLYSLGYRESRQNVEDVACTGYADAYFAPLVQVLSATNLPWSSWKQIGDTQNAGNGGADGIWPANGWRDYVQVASSKAKDIQFRISKGCNATADGIFSKVKGIGTTSVENPSIPKKYAYGFVVTRRGTVVQLALKMARRREMLMAQGTYTTEVRFQGDPNK